MLKNGESFLSISSEQDAAVRPDSEDTFFASVKKRLSAGRSPTKFMARTTPELRPDLGVSAAESSLMEAPGSPVEGVAPPTPGPGEGEHGDELRECGELNAGKDQDGTDVSSSVVSGTSAGELDQACCGACHAESRCTFWVRESGDSGSHRCWLKTAAIGGWTDEYEYKPGAKIAHQCTKGYPDAPCDRRGADMPGGSAPPVEGVEDPPTSAPPVEGVGEEPPAPPVEGVGEEPPGPPVEGVEAPPKKAKTCAERYPERPEPCPPNVPPVPGHDHDETACCPEGFGACQDAGAEICFGGISGIAVGAEIKRGTKLRHCIMESETKATRNSKTRKLEGEVLLSVPPRELLVAQVMWAGVLVQRGAVL